MPTPYPVSTTIDTFMKTADQPTARAALGSAASGGNADISSLAGVSNAGLSTVALAQVAVPSGVAAVGQAVALADNGFTRPAMVNPDGTYALLDQDSIFVCMANTGSGVTKGQAVYINGINANTKPNVGLAKADAIATSYCLGFALDTVADGAPLRVLSIGRLAAVTTPVGVTAGRLFLSDSIAGAYSNTAPTAAGRFSCSLGYCRVADSSGVTGSIEARATTPVPVTNGISTFNAGNSGATTTIDWSNGPDQILTLTANCTLTFTGTPNFNRGTLRFIQGGSGGYTLTWPANVRGPNGTRPQPTAAVGAMDMFVAGYDSVSAKFDVSIALPNLS